jgi:hypothetical protein
LKYYLSGAITYQPDFKDYFAKYELKLRNKGITDIFNPAATEWPKDVKWETCMRYDIKNLMDCDVLVLLPNWSLSRGVQVELYIAENLGIRIVEICDLLKEAVIDS